MELTEKILEAGFSRVAVLDGAAYGAASLLIAFMTYEPTERDPDGNPWIHPYYPVSQRAYFAAKKLTEECPELHQHDEIRVKPIFARIPWLTQGRNTVSYLPGTGSRFHVQIFTSDRWIPPTDQLLPEAKPLHCGACRKCMEACPTHAIDEEGFHRERCIRNWQMSGQPVPEEIREKMGNRLIGCDDCQRCCPHNPLPEKTEESEISLPELLTDTKAACETLKQLIGANLSIKNRVLSQAELMAGCSGNPELISCLQPLLRHPSPVVSEYAEWAIGKLK